MKRKRTCNNCMDAIVCYGMEEPDNPEKGETCPDWHLNFMIFQEEFIKEQETNKNRTGGSVPQEYPL